MVKWRRSFTNSLIQSVLCGRGTGATQVCVTEHYKVGATEIRNRASVNEFNGTGHPGCKGHGRKRIWKSLRDIHLLQASLSVYQLLLLWLKAEVLGKPHSREKALLLLCGLEPWRIPHLGKPLSPLKGAIYMFRKSLFHLLLLEVKRTTSINNLITSSISRARSLLKPRCLQRRTLSNLDFNTPGLTVYSA